MTAATIDATTLLLAVSYRRFGTERTLTEGQYTTEATEKSATSATKTRLRSKALDKVAAFDSQTQKALAKKTLPSLLHPGVVRIHRDALSETVAWLESRAAERAELVAKFSDAYPDDVLAMKDRLGPLFDLNDYPTPEDAIAEFAMTWRLLMASVPDGLPPEVQAAEEARYKASLEQASQTYTALLRGAAADLVADLSACLGKTTDALGRKNPVRAATLNRVREFVQTFPTRNVAGDAALNVLIGQAHGLLEQLGAGDPNDETTRAGLTAGFAALGQALEVLADGSGATRKRKITLED